MKNFFFILAVITLTSCSKNLIPFTEKIRQELTEDKMKEIIFYTSEEIVLTRDTSYQEVDTKKGGVITSKSRKLEEVIIPAGTKGRYLFSPKDQRGAFTFDKEGSEENESFHIFGANSNKGNVYSFIAKEWKGSTGKATYEGKIWDTSSGAGLVFLSVDEKVIRKMEKTKKVLKGAF